MFKCTFYSSHNILPLYFRLATLVAKKCDSSYRYGITISFVLVMLIIMRREFQFLIGTVLPLKDIFEFTDGQDCTFQFLIGTVLHDHITKNRSITSVSIPYRYDITGKIIFIHMKIYVSIPYRYGITNEE